MPSSSQINSENREFVQAQWAASHLLGYNSISYGDGKVTLLDIQANRFESACKYVTSPIADTTIESILSHDNDPWTPIQLYNGRIVKGGLTFLCGEGAMGNEGFVAAIDAKGLVWALFSTESNPFVRIELVRTKLKAYSHNYLYIINLEQLTDIEIESHSLSIDYLLSYCNKKNIADLIYQTQASGEDILCNPTGEPYTGVVYEALPSGSLTAEYEVKNGRRDGITQEYYSAGYIERLANYKDGYLHGDTIYYFPDGPPREKSVFEYEILKEEFSWDEAENLIHHRTFPIKEHEIVLAKMRKKYNEPTEQ
jgi:hypothetical protein